MGRTLSRFLNVATVGAETSESGKLFHKFTTLLEKKWPANLVLVCLKNSLWQCPRNSLWGRVNNLSTEAL